MPRENQSAGTRGPRTKKIFVGGIPPAITDGTYCMHLPVQHSLMGRCIGSSLWSCSQRCQVSFIDQVHCPLNILKRVFAQSQHYCTGMFVTVAVRFRLCRGVQGVLQQLWTCDRAPDHARSHDRQVPRIRFCVLRQRADGRRYFKPREDA